MSDSKTVQRIDSTPFQSATPQQNVQGWERIGSLAGGVVMMGKGHHRPQLDQEPAGEGTPGLAWRTYEDREGGR